MSILTQDEKDFIIKLCNLCKEYRVLLKPGFADEIDLVFPKGRITIGAFYSGLDYNKVIDNINSLDIEEE